MTRALLMMVWGWTLIWSWGSGRLDLLLRGVFHSLVGASGAVLVGAGLLLVVRHHSGRSVIRWPWLVSAALGGLVLLIPPNPSFSDLASNRPQGLPEPAELAFVLPPEQRSLTEWVRLLRSQPDPQLVDGNPVNIRGFVWTQPKGPPLIARLTVRCCLADATPSGLVVAWPEDAHPKANQWLAIQGRMTIAERNGEPTAVVVPTAIKPIPRPKRPLEP